MKYVVMGKRTGEKYMPRGRSAVQEHAVFICFSNRQANKNLQSELVRVPNSSPFLLKPEEYTQALVCDNITERSVSPKMIECQDLASYRLLCKPSGCVVLAER